MFQVLLFLLLFASFFSLFVLFNWFGFGCFRQVDARRINSFEFIFAERNQVSTVMTLVCLLLYAAMLTAIDKREIIYLFVILLTFCVPTFPRRISFYVFLAVRTHDAN